MFVAMRARGGTQEGYSLLELMVVVAVIGILVAIAVPIYVMYRRTACDSTAQAELNDMKAALSNLAAEMNDNCCTVAGPDGNPVLKGIAEVNWTSAAIGSLVGYYGWGGTSRKCDVRVRFVAASGTAGQPDYMPARFQAASLLGRRPDGEGSPNRWVYQIGAAGGSDLVNITADPTDWSSFVVANQVSMGCGP